MGKAVRMKRMRNQRKANAGKGGGAAPFRSSKKVADYLANSSHTTRMLDAIDSSDTATFIASFSALSSQGVDPFKICLMMPMKGGGAREAVDLIHYASWRDSREIAAFLMRIGLAEKKPEAMEAVGELVNGINFGTSLEAKEKCGDLLKKTIRPIDIVDAREMQVSGAYQGSFIDGAAAEILMAQASAFIAEHEKSEINSAVCDAITLANPQARQLARL